MATLFPNTPLKGQLPGVDRKQVSQPFCVEGNNFMLDIRSVYTAFGSHIVNNAKLDYPKASANFQLENSSDVAVCTDSGVYLASQADAPLEPIWLAPAVLSNAWPWTKAFSAGAHYFCRRGYPVIKYNPNTRTVTELDDTFLPNNPSFIINAAGRLVLLGDDFYTWSAFDSDDFQTSTVTRAGAQFTALIGGGEPRALFAVTGGFYAATTQGIIRATFVDTAVVYEHLEVENASLSPVDPHAWTVVDRKYAIVVSSAGMYKVQLNGFELWQPVVSEFLHRQVTPTYRQASIGSIKVSYLDNLKYLFVSLSTTAVQGIYTSAFVYDMLRDEWGSFDQLHTALGPVPVDDPVNYSWEFGFTDTDGLIRKFVEVPQFEVSPAVGSLYVPLSQFAPIMLDDVMEASSSMLMTSFDMNELPNYPGFYSTSQSVLTLEAPDIPAQLPPVGGVQGADWNNGGLDEDWNLLVGGDEDYNLVADSNEASSLFAMTVGVFGVVAARVPTDFGNLVSDVLIGPYRLIDEQRPSRMSYVTEAMVGMEDPVELVEHENWNDDAPAEDWNLQVGSEDWGIIALTASNYRGSLLSTIDGFKPYVPEQTLLEVTEEGENKQFAVDSNGIYHFVRISADQQNEAFRLKFLELSGSLGGLL